jgi:hypothetical protein
LGDLICRFDRFVNGGAVLHAHKALAEVKAWVEANGLTLHPDKTHVGDCRVLGDAMPIINGGRMRTSLRLQPRSMVYCICLLL